MPYLKIQTNVTCEEDFELEFLAEASRAVAQALGKPEQYVMVALEPSRPMVFAGSDTPTVYMELKSIGLLESQTGNLSDLLCELIERTLGVAKDRIYISFQDAPRAMWGWNGTTF